MVILEAQIKIESRIENLDSSGLPDGEPEKTVSLCDGFLHYSEDGFLLTYSESGESGEVDTDIYGSADSVTVKRRGAINSELVFKEGEKHKSLYEIPPYKFDAEVTAKRRRVDLTESGGTIDLLYYMKIGGAEKSARMKIWISTNSKQA